ncbi:methionine synthase reductase isoform X1 [Strongylocentrotus purpuratus]|uniref:Methionine synthase reductase n=1 Tax=Strongylocentrotus purpuratus TaxID=7668 RepID=A0A7M7SSH8_STRPU|nr:methionine synthase reductase isoform X1 [Strongylocentrotus purpuratus]XP_030827914.1 methionine synthase reductase isoform X1 [Strongylocentrotus purpuratus]
MGKKRFLLLYGSETGQSQAIAEEIHELSSKHDLESEIHCLSLTEKKFSLSKETCMVMVVSTTGEGECPETAMKFWRRLRKTTLPSDHLANLNFALLALGDSNYSNFCRNGKNFDERLQELGAKHIYPTGYADDATGLEVVVEPWIEGLWKALHKVMDKQGTPDSNGCLENGHLEINGKRNKENRNERMIGENAESGTTQNGSLHIVQADQAQPKTGEQSSTGNNTSAMSGNDVNGSDSPDHPGNSNNIAQTLQRTPSQSTSTDPYIKVEESTDGKVEGPTVSSLTHSLPPLSESGLTLPALPPPFLKVVYAHNETIDLESLPIQGGAALPSASSGVIQAMVVKATQLTRDDAVKTALDIELKVAENSMSFQPGDSFSIICPNDAGEVTDLLHRLGLREMADVPLRISVLEGTKKRKAAVADFVPTFSTLRYIFTTCCDVRVLPKKAFLRTLVEYTSDPKEKRRLQELCSKQGQPDYAAFLRAPSLSLMDVLIAFPSCLPPIERILEHMTRLKPRPYSISSSPLTSPTSFHFVFNIIDIPAGEGRSQARKGVCTGWLSHLATRGRGQNSYQTIMQNLEEKIDKFALEEEAAREVQIPIYSRTNQHFHLPSDTSKPLVLIGPGTGVAPFIGFLEHRSHMMKEAGDGNMTFGPVWLLFGCRHKDRDYLYREKLEEFQKTGVLSNLCVSFSRDEPADDGSSEQAPRYVQDNMKTHKEGLSELLLEKGGFVYVCGDAKNMAKNVLETWKEILKEKTGQGDYDMLQLIANLREEKRYVEDVWT